MLLCSRARLRWLTASLTLALFPIVSSPARSAPTGVTWSMQEPDVDVGFDRSTVVAVRGDASAFVVYRQLGTSPSCSRGIDALDTCTIVLEERTLDEDVRWTTLVGADDQRVLLTAVKALHDRRWHAAVADLVARGFRVDAGLIRSVSWEPRPGGARATPFVGATVALVDLPVYAPHARVATLTFTTTDPKFESSAQFTAGAFDEQTPRVFAVPEAMLVVVCDGACSSAPHATPLPPPAENGARPAAIPPPVPLAPWACNVSDVAPVAYSETEASTGVSSAALLFRHRGADCDACTAIDAEGTCFLRLFALDNERRVTRTIPILSPEDHTADRTSSDLQKLRQTRWSAAQSALVARHYRFGKAGVRLVEGKGTTERKTWSVHDGTIIWQLGDKVDNGRAYTLKLVRTDDILDLESGVMTHANGLSSWMPTVYTYASPNEPFFLRCTDDGASMPRCVRNE